MPQFILDTFGADANPPAPPIKFRDLDAFTQGYIEALFFTEHHPSADLETWREREAKGIEPQDGSIPCDLGFDSLAPDTLAAIMAECAAFQEVAHDLLGAAYDHGGRDAYCETSAGHDFWLSRNGHGVGFWDRGLGAIGDDLSALCGWRTAFSERSAYLGDDDLIHVCQG